MMATAIARLRHRFAEDFYLIPSQAVDPIIVISKIYYIEIQKASLVSNTLIASFIQAYPYEPSIIKLFSL